MLTQTRNFLISSHGKVIGHCRRLMAQLPAEDPLRTVLDRRLVAAQAALENLTKAPARGWPVLPHSFQSPAADNENIHRRFERMGA